MQFTDTVAWLTNIFRKICGPHLWARRFPLVPELCLGTQASETLFRVTTVLERVRQRETEFPQRRSQTEFGNEPERLRARMSLRQPRTGTMPLCQPRWLGTEGIRP